MDGALNLADKYVIFDLVTSYSWPTFDKNNQKTMKHIFTFGTIILFWSAVSVSDCTAQFYGHDSLDINNIGARINVLGDNFDNSSAESAFDAPINTNMHTIDVSALWIGGYEKGNLKVAAMTYRQSGVDFFPGPLDTLTDSIYSAAEMNNWNQVWKVKRSEINDFLKKGTIYTSMTNWPGNGHANANEARMMAPFVDVDGDHVYDPAKGDYPDIKGDEMLWWVMNDKGGQHGESKGNALGVEVQCEAYAFNSADTAINNTIFLDYKIINRSPNDIDSAFVSLWTDFDIGYAFDDYIGSAPKLSAYFGYNGKPTDAVYGSNPPVESVVFLKDSISRFLYYNNNADPINGDPGWPIPNTLDYYNYMKGVWKNGACMKYGSKDGVSGTQCTNFMFGGAPSDTQSGWTEHNVGNTPGDIRGIGSIGPFTIKAGQTFDMPVAYVFSRQTNGNTATNYDSTVQYWKQIRTFYNSNYTTSGINNASSPVLSMKIFPNPASDKIFIQCPNAELQKIVIIDMTGRIVYSNAAMNVNGTRMIDVLSLSNGIYTVMAETKTAIFSQKFEIIR